MVRSGADFSALYKEMNRAQKRMSAFQKGISKTMKVLGITLGSLAVGKLIKDSISAAMNVENSMLQIQRTMGDSANAFNEWAQTQAKAYGMAREEAFKYGATYSNLISSFTKDTQETARYTTELLKASAVVASATGRTMEDTMERIRSGLLGNTEAIEDLGIHVNVAMLESTEAFRQFARGRSWQQLTFQEQQQIRLLSILEQANIKYGDSLAGTTQTRQLMFLATLKNIRLNLGQAFLPIYNTILPLLTALASKLEYVTAILAQFMQALFGVKQTQQQVKATQAQASAVENLGDATEKAGKQAKGAVASFDEVHQLDIAEGGAASDVTAGGGVVAADTTEIEETAGVFGTVSEKAEEMAARVRTAFENLKNAIVENKNIILPALGAIAGALAGIAIYTGINNLIGAFKTLQSTAKLAWAALLKNPILLVVAAIGALIGALITAYLTNDEFREKVDQLWARLKSALVPVIQAVGEVLKWVWDNIMVPVGQFITGVFVAAWKVLGDTARWLWQNVLVPLGDFLKWLWNSVFVPVGKILIDVLAVAFNTVAEVAKILWQNVLQPFGSFLATAFVDTIKAVIDILSYWGSFILSIFKPIVEGLITVFTFLWKNVLKPLAEFISGVFIVTFETVTGSIKEIINGLKTTFSGLINFITGIFTKDWERAWSGVKDVFKGILDAIKGIFKNTINGIIGIVNTFIDFWNSIELKVPAINIPFVGTVGGFTIGLPKIPRIPKLAKGGIVTSPTLAMIGERGPEAVIPLANSGFTNAIEEAIERGSYAGIIQGMRIANASGQGQGRTEIIFKVNGREMARALWPDLISEAQRMGYEIILRPQGV